MSNTTNIVSKLDNKSAIVGIVGLGYVGLPLAMAFAEAGFQVIGYDIQVEKVNSLKRGISYIEDVNNIRLAKVINAGKLLVTAHVSELRNADTISICVPTPLTKQKDPKVSYIVSAAERLSNTLQKGQLVILESSTYPGTTREIVLPILERSNLIVGKDFYLAFSPERVDPTNRKYNIKNTPKLVGGYDRKSADMACLLYSKIVDEVILVSSMEVAEITKLFENCYRLVNIAFVNEFAEFCERMGISIWEVIDSAKTKPFGYMPFYPGPGIGGHCIPINPYFLFCKARENDFHIRFLELATGINEQMPYTTASKIIEALSIYGKGIAGSKILMLGVSYKKDIADLRESPSLKMIEILSEKGAKVSYNDPNVAQIRVFGDTLYSIDLSGNELSLFDCVVIATDHSDYDFQFIVDNAKLVFDTRGVTRNLSNGHNNVVRLGEGLPMLKTILNSSSPILH
jgi:UDP-N-acetyl-D-glucosamine dehydrogenase